jgi:hypothetical protein
LADSSQLGREETVETPQALLTTYSPDGGENNDDPVMLTEDAVVAAVCRSLTKHGYLIEARALATEHGHDIIAVKDGQSSAPDAAVA